MSRKHLLPASLVYLLVLITLPLLFSCKRSKDIVKVDIKRKGTKYLLDQLRNNELHYDWLSVKFSTSLKINDNKHSFTARVRIRKDSAIWVSASPALGIEVARILITKDSLKLINRINSTYFVGSINYLNRFMMTDIDYNILQSMITGNSFTAISDNTKADKEDKFRSSIDKNMYLISTLKKRKLRKTIKGKKSLPFTIHSIWMEPGSFKISTQQIYDPQDSFFKVVYSEFEEVGGQLFPFKTELNIKDEQSIEGVFDFSKVSINEIQKLPFSIPGKYEQIY